MKESNATFPYVEEESCTKVQKEEKTSHATIFHHTKGGVGGRGRWVTRVTNAQRHDLIGYPTFIS